MGLTRVTITLPNEILQEIDREEKNRSRYILDAIEREIARRRLAALETSLENPHPESAALESSDVANWIQAGEADSDLLDVNGGTCVKWTADGWVEGER